MQYRDGPKAMSDQVLNMILGEAGLVSPNSDAEVDALFASLQPISGAPEFIDQVIQEATQPTCVMRIPEQTLLRLRQQSGKCSHIGEASEANRAAAARHRGQMSSAVARRLAQDRQRLDEEFRRQRHGGSDQNLE